MPTKSTAPGARAPGSDPASGKTPGEPSEPHPFQEQQKDVPWCAEQPVYAPLRVDPASPGFEPRSIVEPSIQFPELLRRAETVLAARNKRLVLDTQDAMAAGITATDVCLLQRDVAVTNRLIVQNLVALQSGIVVAGLTPLFATTTIIDKTINGERYVLRIELKWYGTRFYISKALLNKIAQLLAVGAGVAGALAALQAAGIITAPSAVLTGLIAAMLALGSAVLVALDFCNGIFVVLPHTGGAIPYPA